MRLKPSLIRTPEHFALLYPRFLSEGLPSFEPTYTTLFTTAAEETKALQPSFPIGRHAVEIAQGSGKVNPTV
jgi:hypothetical protein